MSLVFLTGMPATGKTYWARIWAKYAGWEIVDMDERLEASKGKTIAQLFATEGEAQFRIYELELLQHLIKETNTNTIIACGGGTPVFFNNLQEMKAAGCVVYLQSDVGQLLEHLQHEPGKRPLLQTADTATKLTDLLAQRRSVYEQAHLILPTGKLTDITFTEILKTCTNRHL